MKELGNRYNEGKIRYDLIPPSALNALGKVFSYGDQKYGVEAGGCNRNWEKGLKWNGVIASALRHIESFRSGKDFDDESGLLHVAHAMANLAFIVEYYKTHPELDDRPKMWQQNNIKIGLDLDGVIFDFVKAYEERFKVKSNPYWSATYQMKDHLKELEKDENFWVNLPVMNKPEFEVDAYITSRSVPKEWIEESIQKNGLPCAPVYTVPWNVSKLPLLKELGISIYIDDKFENFKEANNAGIVTYLMDAESNRYYNVGSRRIYNLNRDSIL